MLPRRLAFRKLLSTVLTTAALSAQSAPAIEVASRSAQEQLERALYGTGAPEMQSYQQQINDAVSIRTMRGVWQLREFPMAGGSPTVGTLTFRGAGTEAKGTVAYAGLPDAPNGRGPWVIKPDGFGRSPRGAGGVIEQKALWKLRRAGSSYTYAGRINVGANPMDARVQGDVIQLINGGKPKGGSEKKVGTFDASLQRLLTQEEENASTDSAAAGGKPEALDVVCVVSTGAVSVKGGCR